jgi:putative ABC transport system permease protein
VIVGIGRLRGVGFSNDALLYMDYRILRQLADFADVVAMIAVDTRCPSETRTRIVELGASGSRSALAADDLSTLIRQAEAANANAVAFNWILSVLALIVGGLFVGSMLARSVAERRLEFATLRAIGVPDASILGVVGLEALLISAVAGVLGIGMSLLHAWAINSYLAPSFGLETLYVADAGLFLVVIGLALGLALVAAWLPARQAIRVDPAEVLREA